MTIFYYGPNNFEMKQALQQMIEAYIKKAGSNFGLERLDGATAKVNDISAALQASPFLASSRLVIIEGLALNKSIAEKLPALMAAVPATTVALFADRDVDMRTNVFKQLSKADKVVKFEAATGPKLLSWVKREIEQLGGKADNATIRELVEVAGEDQWRLAGEINKLVNFNPEVSVKMVRELVAPSVEQSIFEMVEAMTAGRVGAALAGFRTLLEMRESEIYVLTMVQWQLRNLLLAKTSPANMSPNELAKAAGMSPYVAGKMAAAQSRMSEETLKRAFALAADCEYNIKSGRLKGEPAVEQLIFQVASSNAR